MKSVLVSLFRFLKDASTETSLVVISSVLYLLQEFTLELEKILLPVIGKIVLGSKRLNDTMRSGQWTYRGVLTVVWEKVRDLPKTLNHVKSLLALMVLFLILQWRSLEEIFMVSLLVMSLVYN